MPDKDQITRKTAAEEDIDLTGRKQMVGNVLSNWSFQLVYIASGIVMPRLIDHHLGQVLLGVWDLAWSVSAYFTLVQVGIVSSITRYVGQHYAVQDIRGLNRSVSSVAVMLGGVSLVIVALVFVTAGYLLPNNLGANMRQAQWTVTILGLEVAVQTVMAPYGGVLTGCHRWKLFNGIQAIAFGISAVAMVVAIYLGGQLPTIALLHGLGLLGTWIAIAVAAHRIVPGLKVRPSLATVDEAKSMFFFGGKVFVSQMGAVLVDQTVSVLLSDHLGTASLALFNRPRSLLRNASSLTTKMAGVLVPSSGSLQASGSKAALQELTVKSARYGAFVGLPMTIVIMALGGPILVVWMGLAYKNDLLCIILGLGAFVSLIQVAPGFILAGMNRHGPLAVAQLLASAVTAAALWVGLEWFHINLIGAAICSVLPTSIMLVFWWPAYTARCIGMPLWKYLHSAYLVPLLSNIYLLAVLLVSRFAFGVHLRSCVVGSCVIGAAALVPVYWKWALPPSLKIKIKAVMARRQAPIAPVSSISVP